MSFRGYRISVVMPAYNEEEAIGAVVGEILALPEVDEVVVVDNNSKDRTAELAVSAGARVVQEEKQGYGHASKRALLEAQGDWVVIIESDGTFHPADVRKLLQYGEEFDAVFGTRTSKSCIWHGSNMGIFLRYGNTFVAKLLEYLHNGPCLTDVGCTFKLIHRQAIHRIADLLEVGGSAFSVELMITLIRTRMRCVEIPVHYRTRLGESKITGNHWKAFTLGLRMIGMIIRYFFRRYPQLETGIPQDLLNSISELQISRVHTKSR